MDRQNLALFDFDGTIITGDSFLLFIQFYHGKVKYWLGMLLLSPILVAFKLGLLKNYVAKQMVITWFFKGEKESTFNYKGDTFAATVVPKLVKKRAMEKILEHKQNGDHLVIVSASPNNWIRHWAHAQNMELVSTELKVENGSLTGKIKGKNCYGEQKVVAVKNAIDLSKYGVIHAYGDSAGDTAMLNFADHGFYRPF